MKKFMFTAIAMVAFVGSSMANTIEEDSKVKVVKSSSGEPTEFQKGYCTGQTDEKEQTSIANGTGSFDHIKYKAEYDKCIKKQLEQLTPMDPNN